MQMDILKAQLARRSKLLAEQRKKYLKELLALKEQVRRLLCATA